MRIQKLFIKEKTAYHPSMAVQQSQNVTSICNFSCLHKGEGLMNLNNLMENKEPTKLVHPAMDISSADLLTSQGFSHLT
jgi:hypothetical protein